ncbi:hypothetical protein CVU75_01595 [Candidatus Dependentiae bacterium HGW-Dependentiae-1]|nr:MAG: hypothetical protein CVU75_01595 [Candidatus Dependentiae bacterium HGW-Dependentiae-1]
MKNFVKSMLPYSALTFPFLPVHIKTHVKTAPMMEQHLPANAITQHTYLAGPKKDIMIILQNRRHPTAKNINSYQTNNQETQENCTVNKNNIPGKHVNTQDECSTHPPLF